MEKKNGGFTLIELLIAITVLSIMAGVLLQTFVVGGRINTKARVEERVQDMARRTMEEMKGLDIEALEELLEEGNEGTDRQEDTSGPGRSAQGPGMDIEKKSMDQSPVKTIEKNDVGTEEEPDSAFAEELEKKIQEMTGSLYHFNREEDGKWEFTALYRKDGRPAGDKKADYLIRAVIDREPYSDERGDTGKGSVSSVNQFEMPNIADVSSPKNVVLEPEMVSNEEDFMSEELLLQVNPQEEDDEEEEGGGASEIADGGNDIDSGGQETVYSVDDIKRYILVNITEKDEKLAVKIRLLYTVDGDGSKAGAASGTPEFDEGLTLEKEIINTEKRIAVDGKTGSVANRIYLFLPQMPKYTNIFISGETDGERQYEIYVISHQNELSKEGISVSVNGHHEPSFGEKDDAVFKLYTYFSGENNQGEPKQLVSFREPEDRLYHLTVTVYRATYSEEGKEPEQGEPLLELDSTKEK